MSQTIDAATIGASVTVAEASVVVTATQDLLFGTHFPSEGSVANEQYGNWVVVLDDTGVTLDYTISQLPSALVHTTDAILSVPIAYGSLSLAAQCDSEGASRLVFADPSVGFSDCLPNGDGLLGAGNVSIGFQDGTDLNQAVTVDLTGAAAGTYTGTIELTATIN